MPLLNSGVKRIHVYMPHAYGGLELQQRLIYCKPFVLKLLRGCFILRGLHGAKQSFTQFADVKQDLFG
jgi:hypothetical protein